MRVVIDANVFVSAAIAVGPSHRVVHAVLLSERHEAIVCPALIDEIEDVLSRPRLMKRIGVDHARAFLEDIRILAIRVSNPAVVETYTRDSDDDYLVALARKHDAAYIVTGDKDLLEWAEQRPPAVTPAAFEQVLAEETQESRERTCVACHHAVISIPATGRNRRNPSERRPPETPGNKRIPRTASTHRTSR